MQNLTHVQDSGACHCTLLAVGCAYLPSIRQQCHIGIFECLVMYLVQVTFLVAFTWKDVHHLLRT